MSKILKCARFGQCSEKECKFWHEDFGRDDHGNKLGMQRDCGFKKAIHMILLVGQKIREQISASPSGTPGNLGDS